MRIRTYPVVLLVLFSSLFVRLDAGTLTWKIEKISKEVIENQQSEVKAVFPFTNTGSHPVTITNVHTSCGCTTAGLDKRTYAPGESGEITAVFHPADRTGLQEKYITITTDEPNPQPYQVLLEVNIKEYLTAVPRLLTWKVGETLSERMVVLSALPSQPITEIKPQDEEAGTFTTRIETVEKGQKYNVYVKPVSTAGRVSTAVDVQVKFTSIPDRTIKLYTFVNPPGVSQTDD